MTRKKDYTFVEFTIEVDNELLTVKAKVWYSYTVKEIFVTEHLGQTLNDAVKQDIEIDSFDIEDILDNTGSIYNYDYLNNAFDGEDPVHEPESTEDIEKIINDSVEKDYTKYFSLN